MKRRAPAQENPEASGKLTLQKEAIENPAHIIKLLVRFRTGSQANMAAYAAVLQPGDVIFGMELSHGGHLTHGSPVNFSGKTYTIVPYGVSRETETIDYDELERLAVEKKPKLILSGATAYPR